MTAPAVTPHVLPDLAPAAGDVDQQAVATIRMLAADAVEAAGSGHPGLPMGAAAPAYVLWSRFLRHDPVCPAWPDRDRFVLSAGHGSALLYALLHLFGYDLPVTELRAFRQWGSRTPGHPEHGHTPGVETTTGPLGQGLANAAGMALAERMLAARYNRPGCPPLVDHRTFVLASDGDLMEGISHEAASLAGHLRLGRLIVIYDDNRITIDGDTALSCSDDVSGRFTAYGWHVQDVADGNDLDMVDTALRAAISEEGKPSLIAVRTHIGYGAPGQDTAAAHGTPLGAAGLARTKARFGWPPGQDFHIPDAVAEHVRELAAQGSVQRQSWQERLDALRTTDPRLAADWDRTQAGQLPNAAEAGLPAFSPGELISTRAASGKALRALARAVPELVGGSADLTESTCTGLDGGPVTAASAYSGRNIHFGVREHAMGAMLNGIAVHGGLRPFGSTFLVFSDYMRPAIRLAALMKLPVVYVLTHDSIAVGEDGPTHQPVEQLSGLRAIPGLAVIRPADACEAAQAWELALRRTDGPTALVLSRQPLPVLPPPGRFLAQTGARVVEDGGSHPGVVLVATGSEVSLALEAAGLLQPDGVAARVVSVPWRERFLSSRSLDMILPPAVPRLIIEAGLPDCWQALAGPDGDVIGVHRFGASAPGSVLMAQLGFTPDLIRAAAHAVISAAAGG